jgi:myo-inositol-1(or 4)-monophosphatase
MTQDETAARFDFARQLIVEAGTLAHSYFKRLETLTIKSKGVQDMASEADLDTEMLIKQRLAAAFPQDAFLGEETGATAVAGKAGIWVVDPIDGTQPFVSGMSSWCVSIAYVQEGVLQFGLVYSPAQNELFLGGRGIPATLNGREIGPHKGLALTDGIVSVGYSLRIPPDVALGILGRLLHQGGMFHRNGSGALGLCYVACGRLLGYVEGHINSWDCLGAIAVIEAAGGRTNDWLVGDALTKGNRIVAGPPAVFDQLEALMG